jgi:hypothetical protein
VFEAVSLAWQPAKGAALRSNINWADADIPPKSKSGEK